MILLHLAEISCTNSQSNIKTTFFFPNSFFILRGNYRPLRFNLIIPDTLLISEITMTYVEIYLCYKRRKGTITTM